MPRNLDWSKVTLSYPLYACDFDPEDTTRLVVGGGGGTGKSGIGNKITVLNTSNPHELTQTAEIDLSRDEDSVTSLAVGQSKGKATPIYAGINSSEKSREQGKNEHFRIFGLEVSLKATGSKISEFSRSTLFEAKEKETYQRILRFSKSFQGSAQLGAAATAFASKDEEIVLFDPAKFSSGVPNVRGRIKVDKEAEDLDLIQTGQDEYLLAYCTKHDVMLKKISSTTTTEDPVHITPPTAEHERELKPVYRTLRFLSPKFLLMLSNLYDRKGAVLLILRLPEKEGDRASLAFSKRLPPQIRQATGLTVSNLSPPATPSSELGYAQFVIAVAGHDFSISIYTLDHQREGPVSIITLLKPLQTLKEVHPFQITGLALSAFSPPTARSSSQSLKLASISAGNTVVVHTIPLSPISNKGLLRYVVTGSTDTGIFTLKLFNSIVLVIAFAFLAQIVLELRGSSPGFLNASQHVAPDVQRWLKWNHPIPNAILGSPKPVVSSPLPAVTYTRPQTESGDESLASTLEALKSRAEKSEEDGKRPVIVLREHPTDPSRQHETSTEGKSSIKADLHDEEEHGPHGGKTWEELTKEERNRWIKKLKDAGHWAEDYADTILKGVVFSLAGAAIGGAVGG